MEYTLNLPDQYVHLILGALYDVPFKIAAPVVQAISIQVKLQDEAAADQKKEESK